MKMLFHRGVLILTGLNAALAERQECGNYCPNVQNQGDLVSCLVDYVSSTSSTTKMLGFDNEIPKLTFPGTDGYDMASHTRGGNRRPAAVFYAENTEEVQAAVNCAVQNGFRIAPRGRGHNYQAFSAMDGYVTIDLSEMCEHVDDIEVEYIRGNHILDSQVTLGTIKVGAGCTNAMMMAAVHRYFAEDGGLSLIGGCTSVGIVGFTLSGGTGDATPYAGWSIDSVESIEMVNWEGNVIVASKDENRDLFWGLRGGGGGFGIVTSMTFKIVQAPPPRIGDVHKYTYATIRHDTKNDDDLLRRSVTAIQDFLYKTDPDTSSLFGGFGMLSVNSVFQGLYQGSMAEFLLTFDETDLLNEDFMNEDKSLYYRQADLLCDGENLDTQLCNEEFEGTHVPPTGIELYEFDSYAEALAFRLCAVGNVASISSLTRFSNNSCIDLGISKEFCHVVSRGSGTMMALKTCLDVEVLNAIINTMGDPKTFMHYYGPSREIHALDSGDAPFPPKRATEEGGIMIPQVKTETLIELAKIGVRIFHLMHGIPALVGPEETAMDPAVRSSAMMTQFFGNKALRRAVLEALLKESNGDDSELRGYHNYMGAEGIAEWERFYFGGSVDRISQVQYEYDPQNYFDNPLQINPKDGNGKRSKKTNS